MVADRVPPHTASRQSDEPNSPSQLANFCQCWANVGAAGASDLFGRFSNLGANFGSSQPV